MDPNQRHSLTMKHYDSHANSTNEKERAEGQAFPLKKFHNQIKRELLMTYAKEAKFLLDIACGRGIDELCVISNVNAHIF